MGKKRNTKENRLKRIDANLKARMIEDEVGKKYPSKANITTVLNKLNALPADIKTQYASIVNNLAERCEILKTNYNLQLAMDSVASYEKYKTSTYKTQAQNAVNVLPSGSERDALQARIDAVVIK